MIKRADVERVLNYDADTGVFTWKIRTSIRICVGNEAGYVTDHGYRTIRIDGKPHMAHRLVWLLSTGQWPTDDIDHINRDRLDNRLANLRLATRSENCRNCVARSNNKSGFKGVFWNSQRGRWNAKIQVHGKQVHLGFFDSAAAAHEAYLAGANKYHGIFAVNQR